MNKTYEARWLKDHYAREFPCRLSGYLMRDGRYIDMVDKRDADRGAFYRDDHGTICHVLNGNRSWSGYEAMMHFMERGNIRFSPEHCGFCIRKMPTSDQWWAMKDLWEENNAIGEDTIFEVYNKNGCAIFETTDFYIFRDYVEEHL